VGGGGSVVGGGASVVGGTVVGGLVGGGLAGGGLVGAGPVGGEVVAGGLVPGTLGDTVVADPVEPRRIVVVGARPCDIVPVDWSEGTGATVSPVAAMVVTVPSASATVVVVVDSTRTTRAAAGDCGASDRISVATALVDALMPTIIPAKTRPLSAPMIRRCDRAGCAPGRRSRSRRVERTRSQLTLVVSTGQPIGLSLTTRVRGLIS
jgi:hypothetical protein